MPSLQRGDQQQNNPVCQFSRTFCYSCPPSVIPAHHLSFTLTTCHSRSPLVIHAHHLSFQLTTCHSRSPLVIPAKAGIHCPVAVLDPCLRRDDTISRSV